MTEALKLWSVTTLIRLGLGTSDALVNWAVRMTAEYALEHLDTLQALDGDREAALDLLTRARFRASGRAIARGIEIHRAAEKLALGLDPGEFGDDILPYVEQYRRFLSDLQPEFVMAEAPVYNPQQCYAGTCDAVVRIGNKTLVADIKTTDKAPDSGRSRPPYPEIALQLCAYSRASHVGVLAERRYAGGKRYYVFDPTAHHEPMPSVDGAVAIVVSPYDYTVTPVRIDMEVWRHWQHVRECARWQVDVSRRVFGPQITATRRTADEICAHHHPPRVRPHLHGREETEPAQGMA